MRIGLIDVDGHNFPNLPLMKLSAFHKANGDSVEMYSPMFSGHMDRVYMSKVFSFTPDYPYYIDADTVIRGGSGYAMHLENNVEVYDKSLDLPLPEEVEKIYPDYSLYNITDNAYGFMTRGCPRGCDFCIVGKKEGRNTITVASLDTFWNGQKHITLLDPNPIAAKEWKENLGQLIDSKATVDFTQGIDIRMMTEEKAEYFKRIKVDALHFAWDRYEDKDIVVPKLQAFKEITGINYRKLIVYVLINFNTTQEQDLERVYTLRDLGYSPFVMIYNKYNCPKGSYPRRLQRYVNSRWIFMTTERFEDYRR